MAATFCSPSKSVRAAWTSVHRKFLLTWVIQPRGGIMKSTGRHSTMFFSIASYHSWKLYNMLFMYIATFPLIFLRAKNNGDRESYGLAAKFYQSIQRVYTKLKILYKCTLFNAQKSYSKNTKCKEIITLTYFGLQRGFTTKLSFLVAATIARSSVRSIAYKLKEFELLD